MARTSLVRVLPLGIGALLAAAPLSAGAQQPPAKEQLDPAAEEAQQQFLAGREAVKKGDLARAVALFKRSQELRPTVGTLLNLASVEEQLGQTASALEHFQMALKQLPENDDRLPVAREGVARLGPRVPTLKIDRAAGAPAAMGVKIDGAPLAVSSIGADQPVNPGTYAITTSTPGHEDRRYEVKVADGQHLKLVVEAGKEIAAHAAPPPPPPARSPVRSAGFVLLGVGAAGVVTAAVTGGLAVAKKSDLDAACPKPAQCSADGMRIQGTGAALAGVSTASLVVGGVGLAAGVVMVLVGRDKPAAPPSSARLAPIWLPGGGGISASGAF